jgi:hypothetical protein
MKKKICLIGVMIFLCISGCGDKDESAESLSDYSFVYLTDNTNFLVEQLDVGESGAKYTAKILESKVGCTKITEIEELEKTKCYSMVIVDDNESKFFVTMSFDGYLGYVRDMDGNYLYYEVDD